MPAPVVVMETSLGTIKIELNGFPLTAEPREFSTGSFGWYVNAKAPITVDGKTLQVQVGMNLTVVGSKELPKP